MTKHRTVSDISEALLRLHPYNVLHQSGIELVDIGGTHVLKAVPATSGVCFVLPMATDPFSRAQAISLAARIQAGGVHANRD